MRYNGNTGIPTDEDRQIVDAWFDRLAVALAGIRLPCGDGTHRRTPADEFMLMHFVVDDGFIGTRRPFRAWFKHCTTRNYIGLTEAGNLDIPNDGTPFHLGTFDSGEATT